MTKTKTQYNKVNFYKTLSNKDNSISLELIKQYKTRCLFTDRNSVSRFVSRHLKLDRATEEYVYLLCFNTLLKPQGLFMISKGSVNQTDCCIREIIQKTLLVNADSIILIHNHPSGIGTPSKKDIITTRRLNEACSVMNIRLLDHIVVGKYMDGNVMEYL